MAGQRFELPSNEPVLGYRPGSAERDALTAAVSEVSGQCPALPMIIGSERRHTETTASVRCPHRHTQIVGEASMGGSRDVNDAIANAMSTRHDWAAWSFEARARIFIKAADLLAGPFRQRLNATTMVGQSKTCHQAEIDAACELIDFFRFNVAFAQQLEAQQPLSSPGVLNSVELRPLDGFVFAATPFNFTSIAANLAAAPALMGNTVVWKPSTTQMRSAYETMLLFEAAGLPPGVINLVHGDPTTIGQTVLASEDLAGVHFTGSTQTFRTLIRGVGENIARYRQYPRVVGETGGKDFIFAHESADPDALRTAIVRGGYEYSGQKCSAASRVYVPSTLWSKLKAPLIADIESLKVGDPADYKNFLGAVIDERAFDKIKGFIDSAGSEAKVLAGGKTNKVEGYFIDPTLIEVSDPKHRLMTEEIFGPVVTVYVYQPGDLDEALTLCDASTPYGLTGAVFAQDRFAVEQISRRLRFAAGNFYINDKPTGAVVGQQPFGGSRASGTNDKAGSPWNLIRWISPRTIKETLLPPTDYRYPFLD